MTKDPAVAALLDVVCVPATIVEVFDDKHVAVEIADDNGRTIAILTLSPAALAASGAAESLDAAWSAAEAAKPEDYDGPELWASFPGTTWNAAVLGSFASIKASGPTPAAALHALAQRLTEAGSPREDATGESHE